MLNDGLRVRRAVCPTLDGADYTANAEASDSGPHLSQSDLAMCKKTTFCVSEHVRRLGWQWDIP